MMRGFLTVESYRELLYTIKKIKSHILYECVIFSQLALPLKSIY